MSNTIRILVYYKPTKNKYMNSTENNQDKPDYEEIYRFVYDIVNTDIEAAFINAHENFKTVSGDIFPEQVLKLSDLKDQLCGLMTEQIMQNLETKLITKYAIKLKCVDLYCACDDYGYKYWVDDHNIIAVQSFDTEQGAKNFIEANAYLGTFFINDVEVSKITVNP